MYQAGDLPYANIAATAIIGFVSSGKRIKLPQLCPPDVRELLERCWLENPRDRPEFEDIASFFARALKASRGYFPGASADRVSARDQYTQPAETNAYEYEFDASRMGASKDLPPDTRNNGPVPSRGANSMSQVNCYTLFKSTCAPGRTQAADRDHAVQGATFAAPHVSQASDTHEEGPPMPKSRSAVDTWASGSPRIKPILRGAHDGSVVRENPGITETAVDDPETGIQTQAQPSTVPNQKHSRPLGADETRV